MKRNLELFIFILLCLSLLPLSGCDMNKPPPGGKVTEWALGKAAGALDAFSEEYGDDVMRALDDLKNAEYHGGPFENNLDSARTYLLEQMQEKYGMEFIVAGDEDLVNYGPFAGASYTCDVAPKDAPEQVTTALVSQTKYRDVRDSYAVYFFKDEVEAPVLEFCKTKDYILDQRISLEMPGTARKWTADDGLDTYLSESGAYVRMVLRFEDNLDTRTYAEQILDLLNSIGQLNCNLTIQPKANKTYLFHLEANILDGFDASSYTLEEIEERIEHRLMAGDPK